MKSNQLIRPAAMALAVVAFGCSGVLANCINFGGFAIFQCADLAYFNPPPVPVGFDPNNHPTNVTTAFWQIGFGNNEPGKCLNTATQLACTTTCPTSACTTTGSGCTCSTGLLNKICGTNALPDADSFCSGNSGSGTGGTGNQGANDFNGNDSGIFAIDLKDARVSTGQPSLPAGSLCLSSNNWANVGLDGCAANVRAAALPVA